MIRFVLALALVGIDLPGDFEPFADVPGGPSAEAVNANCLSCHSGEMITTQPRLSRIEWQGEVTKMRSVYKAPVDTRDDAAIVEWLVAIQAGAADRTPQR